MEPDIQFATLLKSLQPLKSDLFYDFTEVYEQLNTFVLYVATVSIKLSIKETLQSIFTSKSEFRDTEMVRRLLLLLVLS